MALSGPAMAVECDHTGEPGVIECGKKNNIFLSEEGSANPLRRHWISHCHRYGCVMVTAVDTVAWAGTTADQIAKRMPLITTTAIRHMTLLLLFEHGTKHAATRTVNLCNAYSLW